MYYGVPMLVMPIINDQPINAEQVEKLNLGKRIRAFPSRAAVLYKQAMSVLNNREIEEECKKMKTEIRTGITIDYR